MKILVIVSSKHIGNTMMVAEAMAEVAPVTICSLEDAENYKLSQYDIVGFGSGVYGGKFDKKLMEYVKKRCDKKAYAFVFSTSGTNNYKKYNQKLIELLQSKNKIVLGSFGCKGLDKFFIFKLFGGLNKGHPNGDDFDNAQAFILDVIKKYEQQ